MFVEIPPWLYEKVHKIIIELLTLKSNFGSEILFRNMYRFEDGVERGPSDTKGRTMISKQKYL